MNLKYRELFMNILLAYSEVPDTFRSSEHALRFIRHKAVSLQLGLLSIASLLPEEMDKIISRHTLNIFFRVTYTRQTLYLST